MTLARTFKQNCRLGSPDHGTGGGCPAPQVAWEKGQRAITPTVLSLLMVAVPKRSAPRGATLLSTTLLLLIVSFAGLAQVQKLAV